MDKVEAYSSTKVERSTLLSLYRMMLVSSSFEIVTVWHCSL